MKRNIKKIVRSLPGFISYCNCSKLCSNISVDHVIPRRLLKQQLMITSSKNITNRLNPLVGSNQENTLDRAKCSSQAINIPSSRMEIINRSINDMHNLYCCCSKLNSRKSDKILGYNYELPIRYSSYLSRAALYMKWKYNLSIPSNVHNKWIEMSKSIQPYNFERARNKIIQEKQNTHNPYIYRKN